MKNLKRIKRESVSEYVDEQDIIEDFIAEYGDQLIESGEEYFGDLVSEFTDFRIDVYYADLYDWAHNNTDIIDEYIEDLFINGYKPTSYSNFIQVIQGLYYDNILYSNEEEIKSRLGLL